MSVHHTASAGAVAAATLDPHQLAALLKPPTYEQQINYVVEHCNYVLPQLAADSLTTSSFPPTFTCLPSSAALESYLAELTASHKLAAHRTAQLESQLCQQLLSSLVGVKVLKQGLSTLPEDIASTEDKLLELCEDLVIESAAASASSAPGTSKDASQTLMNRLDQLHEAIEQLTKAKHYFSILAQVEDLRLSIVKCDKEQGKGDESLQKLAQLDALVRKVEKLSSVGSQSNIGAASEPKLVAFLRAQRSAAFKALRKARCTRLSEAISNAGWNAGAQPNADKDIHHDTAASAEKLITNEPVNHAWADVCQLQDTAEQLGLLKRATAKPAPSSETGRKITASSDDYQPLLTTQCLVEPMLLRFRYHFDGDRSTNRLDKPEWFLSHIAALIKSQSPLFTPASHARPGSGGVVARLNRHYANSSLPTRKPWRHIDTYAELLHGLLTPLRHKLASTLPALLDHPSLLAHTVFQALTFDADLAEAFPPSQSTGMVVVMFGVAGTGYNVVRRLAEDGKPIRHSLDDWERMMMKRDERLTGSLRGQSTNPIAPKEFATNSAWSTEKLS